MLKCRLPKAFGHLVTHYTFKPFEWGPISFFGNAATYDPFSLHIAAMRDRAIWQVTRQARFIHFARPDPVNYDPICFGPTAVGRESPIVRLDHEEILTNNRIEVVAEIAPSFPALAERLMSDGSGPVAIEEWSGEWPSEG